MKSTGTKYKFVLGALLCQVAREASGVHTRNLKIVDYIVNFIIPELVVWVRESRKNQAHFSGTEEE